MELKSLWTDLMEKVAEIDDKLDSRSDGKTAGKRYFINERIEATEADYWGKLVANISDNFDKLSEDQLVGIYYGITRGLDKALGEKVRNIVETQVAALPAPTPKISEEEVGPLQKIRSELYKKIKSIVELAEFMPGEDEENMGMYLPARRTGSKGKRGKRAISYMAWSIDEKEFATLKEVVELYPQYSKVSELTAALKEVGKNADPAWDLSKNLPDRIEYTLPDGNVLVGVDTRTSSDEVDDDDDDDDEDNE